MTPDQLRELADRVSYAATFLMRPGMPSIYWNACNRAADYLRLQAHTHPAPAVPAGWRLVPVEPTPEMLDEGCDVDARAEVIKKYAAMPVIRNPENYCSCGEMLAVQYRAMLAAAPASPQAEPTEAQIEWPARADEGMLRAMIGWRECDEREGLRGEALMFDRVYHALYSHMRDRAALATKD